MPAMKHKGILTCTVFDIGRYFKTIQSFTLTCDRQRYARGIKTMSYILKLTQVTWATTS